MAKKLWTARDVNLVKGTIKQRQAEDRQRTEAWLKAREAELEAVLNRTYDGMDVPGIPELVADAQKVVAPFIAKFNELFVAAYPAQFAKAELRLVIEPGGIPPLFREQVRRDATRHLLARARLMLANIASFVTENLTSASIRGTANEEVQETLARLAKPNQTTPHLEPPGPAIGILAKLLPHPELWGFEGTDGNASSLLPAPPKRETEIEVLAAPGKKSGT